LRKAFRFGDKDRARMVEQVAGPFLEDAAQRRRFDDLVTENEPQWRRNTREKRARLAAQRRELERRGTRESKMSFIATGARFGKTERPITISLGTGWCYSRLRRDLVTDDGGASRGTIPRVERQDFYSDDEAARILKRREHLRKRSTVDATMCDPSPPTPLRNSLLFGVASRIGPGRSGGYHPGGCPLRCSL
jgi:hypothetical protein